MHFVVIDLAGELIELGFRHHAGGLLFAEHDDVLQARGRIEGQR